MINKELLGDLVISARTIKVRNKYLENLFYDLTGSPIVVPDDYEDIYRAICKDCSIEYNEKIKEFFENKDIDELYDILINKKIK